MLAGMKSEQVAGFVSESMAGFIGIRSEVPLEIFPGMKICQIFLHRVTPCDHSSLGAFSGRRKPSLSSPRADEVLRKLRDRIDSDL
jgi:hypothetical protein